MVSPYGLLNAPRSWASMPSDSSRAASTWARNAPATVVSELMRTGRSMHGCYDRAAGRSGPRAKCATIGAVHGASLALVERRIFGLENEYGVTCTLRGQRRLSPDEVARYLFRRVVSWGRSSNVFLENGARLYLDVGSHPEYATPECDSIADLVVHDKA